MYLFYNVLFIYYIYKYKIYFINYIHLNYPYKKTDNEKSTIKIEFFIVII